MDQIKDLINFKREIISFKTYEKFKRIDSKTNLTKTIYEKIEGVLVGNSVNMNQKDIDTLFYFKSQGFNVINVLNWIENEYQRIPPYMINNKFQMIEKFNSIDESYNIRFKRTGDFIVSLFY